MPLRPARCYKELKKPPYTRKEYIKGVPGPKIVKFVMGEPNNMYEVSVQLIALENAQIRHNALEAGRVQTHKYLANTVGEQRYVFIIRQYPHHVLRENKMMAFAGADRLQDGMRQAFGKPVGRAARVRMGKVIAEVRTYMDAVEHAKEALRRFASKLGMETRIVIKELK